MFLADTRLGAERLYALSEYDTVLPFKTEGIVYDAISCHPDIFVCPIENKVVIAPNTPDYIISGIENLSQKDIVYGKSNVGSLYPYSAAYNISFSPLCAVGHFKNTDQVLLALAKEKSATFCDVKQGYTRCNLIWLNNTPNFITSDKGIEKALKSLGFNGVYVNPEPILLFGFEHGFIGGCAGIKDNNIFFTGSLKHLQADEEKAIRKISYISELDIVELSNGYLIDGGSLVYI